MHDNKLSFPHRLSAFWHKAKYAILFSFVWCVFIAFLYKNTSSTNTQHMEEQLLTQAQNLYTFVLDTRNWNAKHGGVYVRESDYGVPNKWLPEESRSIAMVDGTRFVLVNPAYMSRQLSEDNNLPGAHFKITSVEPLRPENKADVWETNAFAINAKGQSEVYSYETVSQGTYFRYLKPLYAQKSCLYCHKESTEGNVLGGISISLNAQDIMQNVQKQNNNLLLVYGFLAFAGTSSIGGFNFLRRRKEQLKIDREKMKECFVANMSHDMRTPLSGILGMSHLLQQEMDLNQRQEVLKYLTVASESLLEMVSDITDYAALDAGKIHLNMRSFALHKELEQCLALFTPTCVLKGLSLNLKISDNVPRYIEGDAFRIRQALGNVVNNAVKFTEQGSINVNVWYDNNVLYLKVTDTGCGITVVDQAHIFSRFERGQAVTQSDKPGTGLGLAIASEVLHYMEGSISVYSVEGEGASFTISVPVGVGSGEVLQEELVEIEQKSMHLPVHVLLVEDNTVTAYFVRTVLEKMGCAVHLASNGDKALELLDQVVADIIILDMRMSGMDGLCTAENIRKHANYETTPIVLMSASVIEAEERRLEELCIAKTLLKPVAAKDLMNLIPEYVPHKFTKSKQDNLVKKDHDELLIYDHAAALRALEGDEQLLKKLVQVWLEGYEAKHTELCQAINQTQSNDLLNLAHSIKNSAATLYFVRLQYEAAKVEESLKSSKGADFAKLVEVHLATYMHMKER